MEEEDKIKTAADRIIGLGDELEAAGHAGLQESSLQKAREVMHQWVDQMKGIVVNPALARVTVIHENGYASSIASADLAFTMSAAGVTKSG
ncbi:MAG TPA: hypothetical protein VHZ99_11330 [Steroidobacteraceae bacterium]|jgi:hypothetical protein|nr:hypothetical protein [Steroidobacteraceae bacterium]